MKTIFTFTFLLIFSIQSNSQPNFIQQNSGTTNNLNRIITVYQNGLKVYIAGDNGTILRTSNSGQVWEMINSNTSSNLYSIEIPGNDTGYAVGSGGTIIRTIDGGITWSSMVSNTNNTLKEIRMMPGNVRAIAIGENGTFLKLVNDVWTVSQIDTNDYNSITFETYNINKFYVVGNNGVILKTLNGGTSWITVNSGTTNNLNCIIPTQNVIVGNNGTALQFDGSTIIVINSGTVNNLFNASYGSRGYLACGANGTILTSWQPVYILYNQRLNSIKATNTGSIFAVGEGGLILYAYSSTETPNAKLLYANNISSWFRNNGSFNRDPSTGNSGFEWPKNFATTARYASGIWMGCKSGTDTLTAVAEYSYDYQPGYVDDFGNPQGASDPAYKIYSITKGDSASPDYQNWPAYQGAYLNSNGRPFFLGKQTMFYSYTDAYPHSSGISSQFSLKAQILQTNWCYTNPGLTDVQFIEFRIINRNSTPWVNTYLAFWTDDDLGTATDDAIGCDTLRNIGYTYNFTNNDGIYGSAPPAVGTKLLRSPIIYTGNNSDTVKYYSPPGSQNLRIKVGYKYTGMSIFNTYNNVSPEPADPQDNWSTYRVLSGLWRYGDSWINPVNGQVTKKAYSGDPVTGTGWNMTGGSDRRFLQSFGPFSMNPNDTQSIIVAQIIARGSSNLNSITQLRALADHVQDIYDENFQSVISVENISSVIPDGYRLEQNYPNPFNPSTIINYELRITNYVSLKVFDALGKEVSILVNEKQSPGTYQVEFDGSRLPSGVYFYRLNAGEFRDTKRMMLVK